MIPTLIGILIISFIVVKMAPGDPASQKFGGMGQATAGINAERGTAQAEAQFRKRLHLDRPLYVQFYYFLKRLVTLDLIYFQQQKPIWPDLIDALQVTVTLNVIVFLLIYMIAVPLGIFSAAAAHSPTDRGVTLALFILYSLPSFWAAEMLRIWFGDRTQTIWFPIMGLHGSGADQLSTWPWLKDYLHHIMLPVFCMTYGGLAYISRQMRVGMLEVIRQDYIRTAEAKGAGKMRVILVHALRNSLFPIITLFASLLPFLVSGSVIIETIFNIPGLGRLAFEGVLRREYDVVMTTLLMSAVLTLFGILISDILYVMVNPQISYESRN